MDARTRDLERRIVAGELGLLVDLRAAYMRLRDPRRDPLPGDVVLARSDSPRWEEHLADLRRVQIHSPTPARAPGGYGRGGILCRVVELVKPPSGLSMRRLQVNDASYYTAITWRPVETFDGLTPSLPRNSRTPYSAWLPSWRRWARGGEVLRVAEELPVQELAREQMAREWRTKAERTLHDHMGALTMLAQAGEE